MLWNYKTFHFSPKMRQMMYPDCKTTLNVRSSISLMGSKFNLRSFGSFPLKNKQTNKQTNKQKKNTRQSINLVRNIRCCCKETPPTTGWNLGIFTRTIRKIRKVDSWENVNNATSVFCMERAHLQQARKSMLCELDCVKCQGRTLHDRIFLKTTLLISWMKCG